MERSYAALRDTGTDLKNCEDWQIKDFFEVCDTLSLSRYDWYADIGVLQRVGLKASFNFDRAVAETTRQDVNPKKYEEIDPHEFI